MTMAITDVDVSDSWPGFRPRWVGNGPGGLQFWHGARHPLHLHHIQESRTDDPSRWIHGLSIGRGTTPNVDAPYPGMIKIDKDLNAGAGGRYIYLFYKEGKTPPSPTSSRHRGESVAGPRPTAHPALDPRLERRSQRRGRGDTDWVYLFSLHNEPPSQSPFRHGIAPTMLNAADPQRRYTIATAQIDNHRWLARLRAARGREEALHLGQHSVHLYRDGQERNEQVGDEFDHERAEHGSQCGVRDLQGQHQPAPGQHVANHLHHERRDHDEHDDHPSGGRLRPLLRLLSRAGHPADQVVREQPGQQRGRHVHRAAASSSPTSSVGGRTSPRKVERRIQSWPRVRWRRSWAIADGLLSARWQRRRGAPVV